MSDIQPTPAMVALFKKLDAIKDYDDEMPDLIVAFCARFQVKGLKELIYYHFEEAEMLADLGDLGDGGDFMHGELQFSSEPPPDTPLPTRGE